jgi:hypothetical protein
MKMYVPVVDQNNKPLMPTTCNRARRWVKSGKATPFWSFGIWCVRLNVEPSSRETQEIAVGIDPGSKREGFTVKAKERTFINIQSKAVTWVKDKVESRRNLRRTRRSRKTPCRQPRWANRPGVAIAPSTKARWQLKLRILKRMLRLYPIAYAVVEDIEASTKDGRKKAQSFQMVMQGKNWLYREIRNLGLILMLVKGWETAHKRNVLGLAKTKDKLAETFNTHCVDSWVLASMAVGGTRVDSQRMHLVSPMNKHYRHLHVQNFTKGSVRKNYGSTRSLGFERGSIIKHVKYGICAVGGTSGGRVSLHSLSTKRRLTKSAKPVDVAFRAFNSFTFAAAGSR